MTQKQLIDLLQQQTTRMKEKAENELSHLETAQLHQKPPNGGWSIAECLHHLNLYGDYYLPKLRLTIEKGREIHRPQRKYKPGWLGGYFANSMLPKKGKVKNKMKTFADKDPDKVGVPTDVLETFIDQQTEMLILLEKARKMNLNKNRIPISIAQWIRLKMGDTFRFVINHNERHMWQIDRVLQQTNPEPIHQT